MVNSPSNNKALFIGGVALGGVPEVPMILTKKQPPTESEANCRFANPIQALTEPEWRQGKSTCVSIRCILCIYNHMYIYIYIDIYLLNYLYR